MQSLLHDLRLSRLGRLLAIFTAVLFLCAFLVGLSFLPIRAGAATSSTINFQARLMNASGSIAPDGDYNVEFKLYDTASSGGTAQGVCTGNCVWLETRTTTDKVHVANGYVTVNLASVTPFGSTIKWDQDLWLTMNIGGTGSPSWDGEMSPRLKLTAVPYAFRAGQLAKLTGANTSTLDFDTQTGAHNILLPDEGGTLCIQSSTFCGFATGSGAAFIQGGNSFGTTATLGTNDANDLALERNNSTKLTVGANDVTLASNIDLLLQGSTAYLSNPQAQTQSEAFGLSAAVSGSNALAVGYNASAAASGVALGEAAAAVSNGVAIGTGAANSAFGGPVAIGQGANASSWGVAIGQTASTSANEAVAIGNTATAGQQSIALGYGADASTSSSFGIAIGHQAVTGGNDRIVIGYGATATADGQLVIGGNDATHYLVDGYLGSGVTNSTPHNFTLQATGGSGSNVSGASLNIAGGKGTGSGNGGTLNFQIANPGSSGSSLNSLTTVASLSGTNGSALFRNSTDSSTGFQVQNAATNVIMAVDTSNGRLQVGSSATDATGRVLVLDSYNGADESAFTSAQNVNGASYYNSNTGKFRCYESSAWKDCIGSSATAFVQNGNSFGATAVLGTNDTNNLQFETNNTVRATFDQSNNLYLGLGITAASPTNFAVAATGSSTAGTAGATLTLQGGAGLSTSTGSAGGDLVVRGGNAGGSGNNAGGSISLQSGSSTATGAASTVSITSGAGVSGNNVQGGNITITTGAGGGTQAGGTLALQAGTGGATGNGGAIAVTGGTGGGATKLGGDVTIQGGTGNTTGTGGTAKLQGGTSGNNATGGGVTIQGGTAGGGNNNGGSVTITGGTGAGTGVLGLISLAPTMFVSSGSTQTFNGGSGCPSCSVTGVDSYSSIAINAAVSALSINIPVPNASNQVVGRILYVTAVSGSNDFTIVLGGTSISIAMKANSTATLIWNGAGWTAAGASSSTDLQSAYNNTLTSAGGAELLLNAPGGNADGLTIRNNGTTPIVGSLLEVQTSIGSNLLSVNNNATEYANNGGAESTTFTAWTGAPAGGTITRDTATVATGQGSAKVVTSGTAAYGVENTLTSTLTNSLKYSISYTIRADSASSGFTTLDTVYSYDGTDVRHCISGIPYYSTGTASQSTTTITGVGTTWTSAMVGKTFYFADGNSTVITAFGSATSLTAGKSQTVASQNYAIYNTGYTVNKSVWARVTCTFIAPASGTTITSSNSVMIRQTDATARTYYVDNLSVTVSADVNHAVDGSVDDATNFATNWTDFDGGAGSTTITRNTTIIYDTSGSVSGDTTANANQGIRNNMTIKPALNTQYLVSFYARSTTTATNSISVGFLPAGGTSVPGAAACVDYNTQSLVVDTWTKITCLFTTDGTAITDPDLVIYQTDSSDRILYVDALSITLNTNNSSSVQIGGGRNGGPTTLLTLDRSSSAPIASNNDAYLGSMYYDTTTGRIQCYEADGWGACGAAPDNYVNLLPEYTGAVLHGSGTGTMTADFCSDTLNINDGSGSQDTICSSNDTYNYYKWTSPQSSQQIYGIYVTYQLPATFKGFSADDTVKLTARVTNTTNAAVTYEMWRDTGGSGLVQCGSGETAVTTSANVWQTVPISGNEATGCSFSSSSANRTVVFRIYVKANSNASAYVSNLSFTTTGQ